MEQLQAELDYEWKPFMLDGRHLTFAQHKVARLTQSGSSHWGPAVYKWEGAVASGPNVGMTGVLIGETSDLRQRIKQYVAGTQERGNKLWREVFLERGEIRLFTLELRSVVIGDPGAGYPVEPRAALSSANHRLVLEQLLVMRAVASAPDLGVWVVNARQ